MIKMVDVYKIFNVGNMLFEKITLKVNIEFGGKYFQIKFVF